MKIGDIVYHRKTGQRLTVKQTARGDGFVLCCWMAPDSTGKPMELSSAFHWESLSIHPQMPQSLTEEDLGKLLPKTEILMPNEDLKQMDELTKSMNDLAQETATAITPAPESQHKRKRQ